MNKYFSCKNIVIGISVFFIGLIALIFSPYWYALEFSERHKAELEGIGVSMSETHFTGLLENFVIIDTLPEDDVNFDEYVVKADVREVYRGDEMTEIIFEYVVHNGGGREEPYFSEQEIISLCKGVDGDYFSLGVGSGFYPRQSLLRRAQKISRQGFDDDQEEFLYCE